MNRQFKDTFACCKRRCGTERYYEIKEAFFFETKTIAKTEKKGTNSSRVAAQRSKDNGNEGSLQVAELQDASPEPSRIHQ